MGSHRLQQPQAHSEGSIMFVEWINEWVTPSLGDWVSKLGYDILSYCFKVFIEFRKQMQKSLEYGI